MGPLVNMKVVGNWLSFLGKKVEVIWTSRTPDMGQTLNSVRAVGQIQTSQFCYDLDLKTALLDFYVHVKVVGLCLTKFV